MKIDTVQAGEILGITSGAVINLVKAGKLHDLKTKKDGAKKHYYLLDSKEVRAFKKVYKKRGRHKNIPQISEVRVNQIREKVHREVPISNGVMTRLGNIETRINILAGEINKLIQIWS